MVEPEIVNPTYRFDGILQEHTAPTTITNYNNRNKTQQIAYHLFID